jgi:RimJ/RimL family protein N-acetyltransferase
MGEEEERSDQNYAVGTCSPRELTEDEIRACVDIVSRGGAVRRDYAENGLRTATRLAVVRSSGRIVGVGALKRIRPGYAEGRAALSEAELPAGTPEVGYIARDPAARGHALAPRILGALLAEHPGSVWATTDSDGMKAALKDSGFERTGNEWRGERGQLSLWIKR